MGSKLVGRPISRLVHADDAGANSRLSIADVGRRAIRYPAVEWRLWDATGVWRQVETIAANRLDDPSVGQIVLTRATFGNARRSSDSSRKSLLHDF